jgi:hypothetical protein
LLVPALLAIGIAQTAYSLFLEESLAGEEIARLVFVGLLPILVAVALAFYYSKSFVEIDVSAGVARLSRPSWVTEVVLDDAEFLIPEKASAFPRSIRLQIGVEVVSCPLLHQGQLWKSSRAERFVEMLSTAGIEWRTI